MSRRLTLAIEISNPPASPNACGQIALGQEPTLQTNVLCVEPLVRADRHDDALMPAIQRALSAIDATPMDLSQIAVSIGPGGYTAIRIACATAATLADACGAELRAIPTALVGVIDDLASSPIAVALASKGETVWLARFSGDPDQAAEEASLGIETDAEGLLSLLDGQHVAAMLADEHLPPSCRASAERLGIPVRRLSLTAEKCLRAAFLMPSIGAELLSPLYPREPDAVRIWRERAGER